MQTIEVIKKMIIQVVLVSKLVSMFRHMFNRWFIDTFSCGRGFQRFIKVLCSFINVRMFEHKAIEQKNIESLKTPFFNIDAIGELIAPVIPYIILDRPVPDVVNKTLPEEDRKIRVHF